jgi:hypothetical protein
VYIKQFDQVGCMYVRRLPGHTGHESIFRTSIRKSVES